VGGWRAGKAAFARQPAPGSRLRRFIVDLPPDMKASQLAGKPITLTLIAGQTAITLVHMPGNAWQ